MKKYLLTLVFAIIQLISAAQTVNVHFKNGQVVEYPSSNVDYVDFSAKASGQSVTAGEAIDLGLSVYWASCNLGASKPEECGDYYAWGETKPKSKSLYKQKSYSYYDSNTGQYINIGEDISNTEYDAAHVNLGNNWRMPTMEEFNELLNNCTWEWIQIDGMNGYKITGNNGNSIFLPAAGVLSEFSILFNTHLYYWASNFDQAQAEFGSLLYATANSKPYVTYGSYRYYGHTIRPVTSNPN